MKCPGCGQEMQPVMRYLGGARWYQFARAVGFCPKCDVQIVFVWTKQFKTFYRLSIWTLWPGIMLLLTGAISHFYLLYRPGEILMGIGTVFFLLAMTKREYGVAPDSALKAGG